MSVELADENDQTGINFAVITKVIVNASAIVALAQTGGTAAIPLQQRVNVCSCVGIVLFSGLPCFFFVVFLACLFLCFFFVCLFFSNITTPHASGKKTVTGMHVVTASQVQSIGCRVTGHFILYIKPC